MVQSRLWASISFGVQPNGNSSGLHQRVTEIVFKSTTFTFGLADQVLTMPSAKLINGSCDIANAIQKATQLVSSGQVQDQEARNKLHTTALALVAALEDPVEAIFRVAFQVISSKSAV